MRLRLAILVCLLLWACAAFAQIQYHDLQLQNANGTLSTGYDGAVVSGGGSSHDLGLGANVGINGDYYNPNFLSFSANSFYDRAQSNTGSTSLSTSEGYNVSSRIFGGSSLPGGVTLGQSWGQSGTYGLPGLTGLNTSSNNRDFSIDWTLKSLPVVKNLTLSYANFATQTTIPGIDITSNTHEQAYGVGTSGYHFAGFSLAGSYQHLNVQSDSNFLNTAGESVSGTSSLDTYHAITTHSLPAGGKFILSAYRTDSSSESSGNTSNNVSDEIDSSISSRIWRVPLSGTVSYNDNVYGSLLQQLNSIGETVPISVTSPRTGDLVMSLSSSYSFPHRVFVTGYITHQEVFLAGDNASATSFGGNIGYGFGRSLKGLTVQVGMHDAATQAGNGGGGAFGTATYLRSFGAWHTTSNVSYDQNVETLLGLYTTSSMSGFTSLRRDLTHGFTFSVTGGFSRNVFVQNAGDNMQSENANAAISWRKQSLTGSYSQSSGSGIITSQGVVAVTTPGLLTNTQVPFSGRGYSAGYSNSMVKNMAVGVGWSRFMTDNSSSVPNVFSNVASEQYTGNLTYVFRKLNFLANVIYLHQGSNVSSSLPARDMVYFFGVSRWFNFF